MVIDKLIDKIISAKNPSTIGLDTSLEYLPVDMTKSCKTLEYASKKIEEFNKRIIDEICDIVPSVKVQVAYYEMYGVHGMQAFYDTVEYAKKKGLVVIGDVKRNDIGSTASCYSSAYLGKTKISENEFSAFSCDFITVNAYLGSDGIQPFLQDCQKYDKGIFVLVKTSNPSSGEFQNRVLDDGKTLYESMAEKVCEWGSSFIGKYSYSSVGGVVGATKPAESRKIRGIAKNMFFLVPGYGAQGGQASDLVCAFDDRCLGAIVNSSRGILCAYKQPKYSGQKYYEAAKNACIDMKEDITQALSLAGKKF